MNISSQHTRATGMLLLTAISFICAPCYASSPVAAQTEFFQGGFGRLQWPNSQIALPDSIAPDSTGMDTLTSVELTKRMIPGWNLGNTLEAIPNETAWGNPLTTQRLIDSIRAAGFRSIRIPVAWSSHFTDTATYKIDSTWMARVEQVVNYALNDSMYAIINEHWDGGWQQPLSVDSAYVNNRLAIMWKQIAIHFRDYDNHLLFAGLNEITVANYYGNPTAENVRVHNSFLRTFVNNVRATGGRNVYRYLLVQGYNTNIDQTVNYLSVPSDVVPNRLIVEVHYYDPYDFTINSSSSIIEWGMYAKDASKTETWANEGWADGQFQKMKTTFIDHGYGVALGEYAASARLNLGNATLNALHAAYRLYYMQYITRSLERHGLVPYYWDAGFTGDNGSGIFDRSTGAHAYPEIISALIDTSHVGPVVAVKPPVNYPAKYFLGQNYPNPFNPATRIGYQIPAACRVTMEVYDVLGRKVRTLVDEWKTPGYFDVAFNAGDLPSGIYFYRMSAGNYMQTRTLVLVK